MIEPLTSKQPALLSELGGAALVKFIYIYLKNWCWESKPGLSCFTFSAESLPDSSLQYQLFFFTAAMTEISHSWFSTNK